MATYQGTRLTFEPKMGKLQPQPKQPRPPKTGKRLIGMVLRG